MKMNRRDFIFSAGAATALAGCRSLTGFGAPELRFGVVSDIHVTTPKSCRLLEKALRHFKSRGVDAVMIPGDLTDWGIRASLVYVKETWDRVFAGTGVTPLFCTGNHDYDGWNYGDMTMEMHANGYSESDRLNRGKDGLARAWAEIFGERFAPARVRSVKGYEFVCGEYGADQAAVDWFREHGERLRASGRPFFYFQHLPLRGTTVDSHGWADTGALTPVLAQFPNCVAFTGHTHRPFTDERSIWQDGFTVVNVPSLSYACLPGGGHENASGASAKPPVMAMQPLRRDLRGGQGYVVDVYGDRLVIERRDLEEDAEGGPAWTVPFGRLGAYAPYSYAAREATEPVPAFPAGAAVEVDTRNCRNRAGGWAISLNCEFPSAKMPRGSRVFDYELKVVSASEPLVRRFFSPAYAYLPSREPARQRFWFDVRELPQDVDWHLEVRARNCFGRCSAPLVSSVWHGKPGLAEADEKL